MSSAACFSSDLSSYALPTFLAKSSAAAAGDAAIFVCASPAAFFCSSRDAAFGASSSRPSARAARPLFVSALAPIVAHVRGSVAMSAASPSPNPCHVPSSIQPASSITSRLESRWSAENGLLNSSMSSPSFTTLSTALATMARGVSSTHSASVNSLPVPCANELSADCSCAGVSRSVAD